MPKATWTSRRSILLILTLGFFWVAGGTAEAKNPDVSYWTKDLSESAASTELGEYDFNPEIAVVGNTVHVLWLTRNLDWSGYKVFYRRSTDNGQTWEPKQLLFADNDLISDNSYKRMVVVGNTVHIAVNYYLQGNTWYGVLGYLRSTNDGASFDPMRILFTAAEAWHVYDVRVASSNGKVTIGFRNQCNWLVDDQYYILNSDDGGDNFTQHTVFATTTGPSPLMSDLQRVGDNIYVLYTRGEWYNGMIYNNLYIAASANAGTNFVETLISVPSSNGNHKTGSLQDYHYVPKIAGEGNNVSVIWNGLDAKDVSSVFTRRSTNSGAAFGDALNLTDGLIPGEAIQQGEETLATGGSYVYGLFVTAAANVYLRRSLDSGNDFLGLQKLSYNSGHYFNGGSIAGGWWPVLALDPRDASGASVQSSWTGGAYVYSTDGGATFTAPEQFLPRGTLQASSRPQMAIGSDGRAHFVTEADFYWPKNIGGWGDLDIFYRGLSPAPGPAGVNNGLKLVSDNDTYRYDNLQVKPSTYLNFTSQMTGEVWVRPYPGGNYTGWAGAYIKPIFHKTEQGDVRAYALQTWDRYGARQAQVQITTTDNTFYLNPTSSTAGLVPDGVWSHLAFTYDAGGGDNNFKLYMNGQLIAQGTATGNLATGDGLFFTGIYGIWDVAELRLWNVVRTQAQIAANMKRSLAGNEAGLNAYYTFKNTTKDITGHGNDGILMYMEQFIQQYVLSPGAGAAVNLLMLN